MPVPTESQPDLMGLTLKVRREVFGHLAAAIGDHVARGHRMGTAVPADLYAIIAACRLRASSRPEATSLGVAPEPGDGVLMTPLALRYEDAAAVSGFSVRHLQRLVRAGDLPAVRSLGSTRIRVADLDHYLTTHTTTGRTAA